MRVTLTFDLPKDEAEYGAAMGGRNMAAVLVAIEGYILAQLKHGQLSEDGYAAHDDILAKLRHFMDEAGVELVGDDD